MSSIQAGIAINSPHVNALDTSKMKMFHISEASEKQYQGYINAQEKFLETQYTERADTSNNASNNQYATVKIDGKVVATLHNSGAASSSNSIGAKIHKLFTDEKESLTGPELAQERAEKIAELLGGTVEISSTAITQEQFNAIPPQKPTIDYESMHEDPRYEQLQKTKQARTLFLAQQFAQENDETQINTNITTQQAAPSGAEEVTEPTTDENDPIQKFLDYMSKTPEERWFDAMLAEKVLTREEYDALPPEEKQALKIEIQEKIRERTTQKAEEGTVTAARDTDNITGSTFEETDQPPPNGGEHPLEYHQIPKWLAQHGNELSSTLGAKPKAETGSSRDHAEYAGLINKHYQSTIKDAGIASIEDHYKATILDQDTSKKLHQEMNTRLKEDTRFQELADILGKQIS